MKIGENGAEPVATPPRIGAGTPRRHPSTARSWPPGDESRGLQVARTMARLVGAIGDTTSDPARAAQLALLRNAVAAGRYQPDLHDVARKLLTEIAAERLR